MHNPLKYLDMSQSINIQYALIIPLKSHLIYLTYIVINGYIREFAI